MFTFTVPRAALPQTVLVTLDGTDLMPIAERPLVAAPEIQIKPGRSLSECRITAAIWAQGRLLAWCPRFSWVLAIDPQSAAVTAVRGVQGMENVLSMTVRDERLLLLDKGIAGLRVVAFDLKAFLGGAP